MAKRVTGEDVAREAGVSTGTVSRVLNLRQDVNAEIRDRVLATIERLGYRKRSSRARIATTARRGSQQSGNIGFIVLGMEDSLTHMPINSQILHGAEMAMAAKHRNLMLSNIPKVDRVPPFIRDRQIDGLIVRCPTYSGLSLSEGNPLYAWILRYPLVWVVDKPPSAPGDLCSYDHLAAGRRALEYLFENGHRKIAFLNIKKGHRRL